MAVTTSLSSESSISDIRGVGAKTAALYAKLGLMTVGDMIHYYPRSYDRFDAPKMLSELEPGMVVSVKLLIVGGGTTFHTGGKAVTYFRAADASGQIRLTYFNQPYLRNKMPAGTTKIFRGFLKKSKNGNIYLEQPKSYTPEEYIKIQGTMQPVYPLSTGLKNAQIVRTMKNIFESISQLGDYLSEDEIREYDLISYDEAIRSVHFPVDDKDAARARKRIVFNEFLLFMMSVYGERGKEGEAVNHRPMIETADPERLIEALPYELTDSQKKAWKEIREDLCGPHIMNRLLQGDVGSGKTILAFLALILTASNGRQGAMMAPTEVLAQQHMKDITEMTKKYHLRIHPVLLTGSIKGRERKSCYEEIASGVADVIIGTHALIQEKLEYHDLGLVVTDEQHRFGVRQRESFAGKGEEVPILVMSATPIPRTLAIILYGDLKVSLLKDMPKERLRIRNTVLDESWRDKAYHFIIDQVKEGHQAYIICPAVEEGETDDIQNVADYSESLRKVMPGNVIVGSLTGRMKPVEKEIVMNDFAEHRIDVLVSTTVVEVGVNVANATVMMVENAERFGLAQLHQLRGRVGRGKDQSYCIFIYSSSAGKKPEKLDILEHTTDGFEIAEKDLKMRGAGDLFGVRQSGLPEFVLADIYGDSDVLKMAAELAEKISRKDSGTTAEEHRELYAELEAQKSKSVDFRTI
ncbi:MAG: ATP-dependent DNA helicase RecG [Lachnospiraceae bacterium]|jgi:ATP-dependent DNA helicase RecG|nr:ATP-dependent DNA helicase RecG [Lachnospiraceae bacterium]MDD4525442.1 ATP-dependent DNA helicase RecG [Lachnospiraceae bacterium]